jgi:hypothetical protein
MVIGRSRMSTGGWARGLKGGVQGVRNQGDFGGAEKFSLRNQGDFTTDQITEPGNQVLGAEPGFTAH